MGKTPRYRDNTTARAAATPRFAQPNFRLVGEAKGPEPGLVDLLRYSQLECVGRHRWRVLATREEWVRGGGHLVALNRTALVCDCRQGLAGRACAHALAVRQLATIEPPRAADTRQLRLFADAQPLVRPAVPSRRFRVEYKAQPAVHKAVRVRDKERAGGGPR